ncbi:acetyl-CoA carboxylase biotin carboxylase subunit [Streptomyces formicae]|uniref:biotin carboxylase n=2 Tax=Streptomyces TaxID=1883 RepID=A0A291QIY0_9ACTN|nr:biotin carboxylase N-terminal domain-containing protein [Streptomyces formicae]AQP25557.1 ACC biotin carboxylase [Streptomyces sp. KY5]ATL31679.1 Biotin carboxylase of acetyl-CoA carboxylase [Streptomyces formicae]
MFRKVLIANRGEIALRVARTCRELGIAVVAVHSTEDTDSAVVRMADEAVCIGPAPARHSYLRMNNIVEAALRTGADAVHPGYGLLSEDRDFAEVCAKNGLAFVGPPAAVIEALGGKPAGRALMGRSDVPLPPGSERPPHDEADALALASALGYPLLVKAAAGGGGRGIRTADDAAGLRDAFREARAEAQQLFGDGRVYLERLVRPARHVEVQVLCDRHGGAVHLGVRDCTVQRRRQKLIEESPAPTLAPEVAREMAEAAVRGAREAGYEGAGTFEFVVDDADRFHFIEVNCRIQVEHPVTEMVTGVDLVAEQLRVAAGLPLSVRQEDVRPRGVAVECRVNAEDPDRAFAPTPGVLDVYEPPGGPFVRVDGYGFAGARVSGAYDPLLAKVITWGPDREAALARMERALGEFRIEGRGMRTTRPFLLRVLADPRFRSGRHRATYADELLAGAEADRA